MIGYRTNASSTDFSEILPEEIEQELKDAAEISMGTEISEEDIVNIIYLCDQVGTEIFISSSKKRHEAVDQYRSL